MRPSKRFLRAVKKPTKGRHAFALVKVVSQKAEVAVGIPAEGRLVQKMGHQMVFRAGGTKARRKGGVALSPAQKVQNSLCILW